MALQNIGFRQPYNLQDTQQRLQSEEDARTSVTSSKKKVEQELASLKKDIEDMELVIQKAEQDKATKDHQIRYGTNRNGFIRGAVHMPETSNTMNLPGLYRLQDPQ